MDYNFVSISHREVEVFNPKHKFKKKPLVASLNRVLTNTPAPFSMSTARMTVLAGEKHLALWDLVLEGLNKTLGQLRPEAYELMELKISNFKFAAGTILLWEDVSLVEDLKETYAMYADDFARWSSEYLGKVQLNLAYELGNLNLCIDIQHYNQVLEDKIQALVKPPKGCKLRAQILFGVPVALSPEITVEAEKVKFLD